MAGKKSAGILMYRWRSGVREVLLVHPGGPFWARKDAGAWSIPKGELAGSEEPLEVARREFFEETGAPVEGPLIALTPIVQRGGKTVHAFAVEGELDVARLTSNRFSMEWPPRSGRQQEFPEVDRAEWFSVPVAHEKILDAQRAFLDELEQLQRARS
jgi:predicted NUDIX family NTP pyrophosphohydrolase